MLLIFSFLLLKGNRHSKPSTTLSQRMYYPLWHLQQYPYHFYIKVWIQRTNYLKLRTGAISIYTEIHNNPTFYILVLTTTRPQQFFSKKLIQVTRKRRKRMGETDCFSILFFHLYCIVRFINSLIFIRFHRINPPLSINSSCHKETDRHC